MHVISDQCAVVCVYEVRLAVNRELELIAIFIVSPALKFTLYDLTVLELNNRIIIVILKIYNVIIARAQEYDANANNQD